MTKHDPAEVEAVAKELGQYTFTAVVQPFGFQSKVAIPTDYLPTMAAEIITALDAHRAPAIRAAVEEFDKMVNSYYSNPFSIDKLLELDKAREDLLSICGITNEQENA